MAAEGLGPGQLVVYREIKSQWNFARVKRVKGEQVVLTVFADKSDHIADRSQIQTIDEFFAERTRVFAVDRRRLTEIFYGRFIERLRPEKVSEMQKALRKGGLGFEPDEWPSPETRIRIWRDTSVVASTAGDQVLASLLPQWLEPFTLPSGSRDPLGLQAPAERLVNEVLPGLTVFTFRAGYYGFLPWAIRCVNELPASGVPNKHSRRDLLNALERALVLCEFIVHGSDDTCPVIGQRSKRRVLEGAENDRFRVPDTILKNQNSAGAFRLFSTSLVSMGLVEEADELGVDGLVPFRLTPLGESVANVFTNRADSSFAAFA